VIALGMGVGWAGYYLGMWGYCLIRGYDTPFASLFKGKWPGPAANAAGPAPPADPGAGTFNV
jgi:hypothetical protein